MNTITKTTATLVALAVLLTFTVGALAGNHNYEEVNVGDETLYITEDGTVYKETNGCDGLQKTKEDCDDDGTQDDPDRLLIGWAQGSVGA